MPEAEHVLRAAYVAFNTRDVDAAIALMHPEVDWPNAWEGGRVKGRAAVRNYWNRQFASISSKVEPEGFTEEPDGLTRSGTVASPIPRTGGSACTQSSSGSRSTIRKPPLRA